MFKGGSVRDLMSFQNYQKHFPFNRNLKIMVQFCYKLPPQCTTTLASISVSGHSDGLTFYSQSRSRVNSNSKNEMNIRISLCNVRRVNGMLDISLEVVPKKTHLKLKKRFKILGKQLLFLKYSILQ